MAETTRTLAKKAGGAAVERTLASLMPDLFRRLDRLDERLGAMDRELHSLREHIDSRFEQARDVANQLGERMARVEGRFDEVIRAMDRQADRLDKQADKRWINGWSASSKWR
jgi:hypothetical protein